MSEERIEAAKALVKVEKQIAKVQAILEELFKKKADLLRELGAEPD